MEESKQRTIVAVADLHIEREEDLAPLGEAFAAAAAEGADIWILGDLFESARPAAALFSAAHQWLWRACAGLNDQRVYLLLGNHDYDGTDSFLCAFRGIGNLVVCRPPHLLRGRYRRTIAVAPWRPNGIVGAEMPAPNFAEPVWVMGHWPMRGAAVSGGLFELKADPPIPKWLLDRPGLLGDIHQPQEWRNLHYVGSARNVTFDERHEPRMALVSFSAGPDATAAVEWVAIPNAQRSYTIRVRDMPDARRAVRLSQRLDARHRVRVISSLEGRDAAKAEAALSKAFSKHRRFVFQSEALSVERARAEARASVVGVREFVEGDASITSQAKRTLAIRVGEKVLDKGPEKLGKSNR